MLPNSETDLELIQSGKLESFCLGILPEQEHRQLEFQIRNSPVLGREVEQIKARLSAPSFSFQHAVWARIQSATRSNEMTSGPKNGLLSPFSDLAALREEALLFAVPDLPNNIVMVPFRKILDFDQYLIRVRKEVLEEIHTQELESFYILEGTCRCRIGDNELDLQPGGFAEIPLNLPHSVWVTSAEPVLAILQRVKIY